MDYLVRTMNHVSQICDAIGREAIMQRLGVGKTAVSNAVTAGKMPASWYVTVSEICREKDVECPVEAFTFKAVDQTQEGAAP